MAGIVGNYIFAYGFLTDIANERYFKDSTLKSDMTKVRIIKEWKPFLNEVGWFRTATDTTPEEQSKLYVFGERILSVEDETFLYLDGSCEPLGSQSVDGIYDLKRQVFSAKLEYKKTIDREAKANGTEASFLFFMNDKE